MLSFGWQHRHRSPYRRICSYAKEPAVHPWTRGCFRAGAGGDGEALINHRGPEYARLLHSIAERMQSIFATTGDVLLLGSSGTGSLEAAVTNMFGPGDTLLACPTGVFGERIATIAKKWGCTVEVLETPWGAGVDPKRWPRGCAPTAKKDHRHPVDPQRDLHRRADRSERDVACDRGSSRVRRRRTR